MEDHDQGFLVQVMLVEQALISVGGQKYYQSASWIRNLAAQYVTQENRVDFLKDLRELILHTGR